ncbi:7TM diverse intracellular signaling domain-containing protein [Hufsiella ginkgonis]|uniref:Chromosome partitioning protein ParA n=1 Tax=Hufsiella ginkgonis TaxID=2695274 RepID=A0A7K1Y1G5_9SPHI|nr:7TM diverse intracellular signaling domain-containing protein [Hufsiella ginkgonis]MXV17085.1 chromosome partitioning protein ParA [Hufsiella ginkgonis]
MAVPRQLRAQQVVNYSDSLDEHIFSYKEIEYLEDPQSKFTLGQVTGPLAHSFKGSELSTPKNFNIRSAYWFRVKIRRAKHTERQWILEFFDQTIDDIAVFSPGKDHIFRKTSFGNKRPFNIRQYHHKNFTLILDNSLTGEQVYYIRIKSHQQANVIVVLRSVNWFIQYALDEYFFFGVFYGMILVFSFYNLMMFFAMRQSQYVYYILYNLSIGLYEMSADGVAYQYLWPNSPGWNQYAYGIALYLASTFALLFTRKLLYLRSKAPQLDKLLIGTIALRTLFLLACLLVNRNWFNYKIIEALPLLVAYFSGWYVFNAGYRPARFFVLGYSFLLIGFVIKTLIAFDLDWIPFGPVTHYSLSFCFVTEMVFVSFAIGDRVRLLRKKKEKVQRRIFQQMKINEDLKDALNKKLESEVLERTREVIEKSTIIEAQNHELLAVNDLLKQQAEEITRMNTLLEQDNQELHENIDKVTRARVMSLEVDFTEFSKIYPDNETCSRFLADLKWGKGYACRKCGGMHSIHGHLQFSHRCAKCGYEESVTTNTILQNCRIPINKAFYMIFLIYSSKGKISSHKLSEILSIRQSTCWAYGIRIKKVMEDRKKELKNAGEAGWSKLVLEN